MTKKDHVEHLFTQICQINNQMGRGRDKKDHVEHLFIQICQDISPNTQYFMLSLSSSVALAS